MKVFDQYAEYYDLLYKDKDYLSEANFIHKIIQRHSPAAQTICDLGCGTGNHAFQLLDLGYQVTGIDSSKVNIDKAHAKQSKCRNNSPGIEFRLADIRDVRLKRTFDVVTSLFHVMSYQTTDGDITAALQTAKKHMHQASLFIFDCWYGPAVLADPPQVRVKIVEDDKIKVIRTAEPEMILDKNWVEINYQIKVEDKALKRTKKIFENHRMRYFFQQEIGNILKEIGLQTIGCREWMTNNPPGAHTWSVYFINKGLS